MGVSGLEKWMSTTMRAAVGCDRPLSGGRLRDIVPGEPGKGWSRAMPGHAGMWRETVATGQRSGKSQIRGIRRPRVRIEPPKVMGERGLLVSDGQGPPTHT